MKDEYHIEDNFEFWDDASLSEEIHYQERRLRDIERGLNNPKKLEQWIGSLLEMKARKDIEKLNDKK